MEPPKKEIISLVMVCTFRPLVHQVSQASGIVEISACHIRYNIPLDLISLVESVARPAYWTPARNGGSERAWFLR